MAKEAATRRSKNQTETAAKRSPTTVHDIPDHLLKLIFGCLDSHVSYLRAAAVCTRWRHIASTRSIMHHDLYYLKFFTHFGHYHAAADTPSLPPAQPRPRHRIVFVPASPSIDAHHFSLDFLPSGPGGRPWELADARGTLLLLACRGQRRGGFFPDLVVCEPISQRYVRIHPIPDMKRSRCLGAFLSSNYDYVDSAAAGISGFTVTCVLHDRSAGMADGASHVTARVYRHWPPPRSTWWRKGWQQTAASSSRSRVARPGSGGIHLHGAESARYAGRSKGFIFWSIGDDSTVLAVREGTAEFSRFRLPEHVRGSRHQPAAPFRFVDDGIRAYYSSLVRVVALIGDELRVFVREGGGGGAGAGSGEWVLVNRLCLAEATRGLPGRRECYFSGTPEIVAAGRGYVVLRPAEEAAWLFSVELETMRVEREHVRNTVAGEVYPYELRTPPKVCACVIRCLRGRNRRCHNICKCE